MDLGIVVGAGWGKVERDDPKINQLAGKAVRVIWRFFVFNGAVFCHYPQGVIRQGLYRVAAVIIIYFLYIHIKNIRRVCY